MKTQVNFLPADSILVSSTRQRKDESTKHISELAKSIERDGLIHAIAVTEGGELISGFCRLSAIRMMQAPYKYGDHEVAAGYVPCLIMSNRNEEVLFRLELEENLRRKNLTPVEEAQAVARLHHMLKKESPTPWTNSDTGKALDTIRGEEDDDRSDKARSREVADAVLLDSFSRDPDVIKASTKAEAIKIAKKKLESSFLDSLGQMSTIVSADYQIIEGDCTLEMAKMPDACMSGIVTDPPYGVDADTFGEQAFSLGHEYEDDEDTALAIAAVILQQGLRICKDNAHLYMFCDIRFWYELTQMAAAIGWLPYSTPLVWHKPNVGHAPQPGLFLRRYETILFARKGNRTLRTSASDVLEFPALVHKQHAAQKPVELIARLLQLSFLPGEHVLDPCAGSGTIFQAAKIAGLRATGIELNSSFANQCKLVIGEL